MQFTENSYLVRLFVNKIKNNELTREDVPTLYNLKDVVYSIIDN